MQSASAEPALGTILLVDDDLELSDTMSEFLKIRGYATLQAQNGQNAIDLLKTMAALPLLIVLDMSMPVLDGRGFLKRRVKDPVLLGIPVVVVSGSDAPASPPMNIIAYLRKPISMKRLMSIIESAFDDSSVWPNLPTSSEPRLCAFVVNINAAPPTRNWRRDCKKFSFNGAQRGD
jgi:CheY-like chemotaxis protein